MIGASGPSGHTRQSLSGRARGGLSRIARRPLRAGVAGAALLASIVTGLALNTPGPGGQVTGTSQPVAAQSAAASVDTGRIAFAGTDHPGLGQVTGTESSEPLFGDGPEHYDKDVYARGQLTVFVSLRDSTHFQVYLRDASGAVSRLTKDMNAADPELSPDGKSVVFDSASPRADGKSQRDLWIVNTDGSGLRRLTNTPDNETSPTFSPDGTRIAFSCKQAGPHTQLYWMPVSGGALTQITNFTGDSLEPEWNPVDDAAHRDLIAYTFQGCECSGPRLRVTTPAGGDTDKPMLTGASADWDSKSAAWLPDGDDFLFMSPNDQADNTVSPVQTVYEDRYQSGNAPQLRYRADRDVSSPAWLGTSVVTGVVVVVRSSASTVNVADLEDVLPDGSDPRDLGLSVLREDPAADTNPDASKDPLFQPRPGFDPWTERQTYTPDGRQIIVTRFQDSAAGRIERIWTVNADGSNPQQLSLGGEQATDWDTDPALSPDGKLLAFTRTSPGGVGTASGPGRVLIADASTGAIVDTIEPPAGQQGASDAQPTWSSDGKEIAFTRTAVIDGNGANKHVWTVPVDELDQQSDLSTKDCPGNCAVIDDSPAFSPDGQTIAFNRKDGDGRVNEKDGVLVTKTDGTDCKVILPEGLDENPDACGQDLPDTSATGPFQPRDVAWSPDGSQLALSSRRAVTSSSPEALDIYDFAGRTLTPVTAELSGRQKEPAFQQTVDLSLTAPPTSDPVQTGKTTTITMSVTNHGSSPSPGTTFTASVPGGAELTGLTSSAGTCDASARTCSLGTVQPGASVTVTATVTGTVPGDQSFLWSVSGAVLDTNPGDDMARTVVPVQDAPPPPPTSSSPPPPPATSTPPPPPTTATPPPPPPAGPAVAVSAQPNPGFVGGRVTVTYTVSNGASARATGLKLRLGLPKNIPAQPLPAGCSAGVCTLSDLAPGGREAVQVVLTPKKASTSTITATLTTTGTDADRGDNKATTKLRVLQPEIVAVPPIGSPGFVTSVRGKDFPPGVPVTLTWNPGITAAASPTIPGKDGKFAGQLLILDKDQIGPRTITAKGRGFTEVKTDFLVVVGSIQPPDEVERR